MGLSALCLLCFTHYPPGGYTSIPERQSRGFDAQSAERCQHLQAWSANTLTLQNHFFGYFVCLDGVFIQSRCRDNAFKLKPLEKSDQLIDYLKALETKLQGAARQIQELVNKNKNKWKHYKDVTEEVGLLIKWGSAVTRFMFQFICQRHLFYCVFVLFLSACSSGLQAYRNGQGKSRACQSFA